MVVRLPFLALFGSYRFRRDGVERVMNWVVGRGSISGFRLIRRILSELAPSMDGLGDRWVDFETS